MSEARNAFEEGIRDAEQLLKFFTVLDGETPQSKEVLKRAGLIMACTAWETYVEDRVSESLAARIAQEGESESARFVRARFAEELKRFNNPNAEKTRKLFKDFLAKDVTDAWQWNGFDTAKARQRLDELMSKRGEAVHRCKRSSPGTPPARHLVTKEDLRRAIGFFRALVDATEREFALPVEAPAVST
jgi:hypothetical protein